MLSGLCDAHRKHFQSLTPETQPPPAYHHIQAPAQPQYEQPSSPGGYQGGSGHPTQAPYHPQPASYRAPPPVSHHPQPLYQGQAALTNPVKLAEALPASHPTHSLAYEDTSQAQYQQLSSHGGYQGGSGHPTQAPYHPQPACGQPALYRAPPPVSHHPQQHYQRQHDAQPSVAAHTNPVKLSGALPASHPTHAPAYEKPAQPQYQQPSGYSQLPGYGGFQGGSSYPTQAPYHPELASYSAPPSVSHQPQQLYQAQHEAEETNPVQQAGELNEKISDLLEFSSKRKCVFDQETRLLLMKFIFCFHSNLIFFQGLLT